MIAAARSHDELTLKKRSIGGYCQKSLEVSKVGGQGPRFLGTCHSLSPRPASQMSQAYFSMRMLR
jgi:hypothetical protein